MKNFFLHHDLTEYMLSVQRFPASMATCTVIINVNILTRIKDNLKRNLLKKKTGN